MTKGKRGRSLARERRYLFFFLAAFFVAFFFVAICISSLSNLLPWKVERFVLTQLRTALTPKCWGGLSLTQDIAVNDGGMSTKIFKILLHHSGFDEPKTVRLALVNSTERKSGF